MNPVIISPGRTSLKTWCDVYRNAPIILPTDWNACVTNSSNAVARILGKDVAIYGINTGFGKLASTRIANDDLITLQRNLVLSHAAGVGESTPKAIVRLMMALKLESLAQGASGVRPQLI